VINDSGLKAYCNSSKNQYLLPRIKNSLQKTTIYFREFFVNLFELKKIQTVVDKNFESFRKEGEYLRLTEEVHAPDSETAAGAASVAAAPDAAERKC
jgi:hypothetical protein